ncbi:MAG: TerC family protein [Flavobacteriales bacterium]|jgi:Membrane protein TerC, possibly involved in tellurium resistance|nr:TerC family protein [Flavobacteriales bacterium]MCA0390268.1 TerC family protein [Bacteroidota bacterium]
MELEIIISLLTLIALEVVLGIDNIIFISILANKLPKEQQRKARNVGILLAAVMRLGLLLLIVQIMKLDKNFFTIFGMGITGKELILILGGLFLIYKSTSEIYHKMEGEDGNVTKSLTNVTFSAIIAQILIMDFVFSIDSIITAVGMVKELWVMYTAVIVSVIVMLIAARPISDFVNRHPAFKILALSFLLLIGFSLIVEGFEGEIPKGYIYFAMAFSLLVDIIQMRVNKKSQPVQLNEHVTDDEK